MTQEVFGAKETVGLQKYATDVRLDGKRENGENETARYFRKQEATNLQVKGTLAQELTEMDLPQSAVHQILNIEVDLPF